MKNNEYKIITSETTKIGRFEVIYDVIERNGKQSPYSYVKMKKGVGVLGKVDGKVILLQQYRYLWDEYFWEIPAGMVDDDENPEEAAKREMEEETGYVVDRIEFLGKCYPSIGSTTEIQYLFYAECSKKKSQNLDNVESISVSHITEEDFDNMIRNGDFTHGMGLAAWVMYKNKWRNN